MIFGKPFEYWAALLGTILYVAARDAEREPMARRMAKVAASALLSFGLTPTVSPYLWGSDVLAAIAVMAFGQMVLDIGMAVLMDKKLSDALKKRVRDQVSGGSDD